jgi:uncharacterized protein
MNPVNTVATPTIRLPARMDERRGARQAAVGVLGVAWAAFAVAALLMMEVFARTGLDPRLYGLVVPLGALALALATAPYARAHAAGLTWLRLTADWGDLLAIALLYLPVVAAFRLAMVGFGNDRPIALFLAYAAGMVLGGAGPILYTVWMRHRPLDDLGIGTRHWRATVALGLALAAVQSGLTLWRYPFPVASAWAPLLAMSLAVGLFEAIFFRGFVQTLSWLVGTSECAGHGESRPRSAMTAAA